MDITSSSNIARTAPMAASKPPINIKDGVKLNSEVKDFPTDIYNFSSNSRNSDLDQVQNQQQQFRNFRFQPNNSSAEVSKEGAEGSLVTVNPGDSLSKILLNAGYPKAEAFSSKVHDEIAAKNGLADKNKLRPGQVLVIPSSNSQQADSNDDVAKGATSDSQPSSKKSSQQSKTPKTGSTKKHKQEDKKKSVSSDPQYGTNIPGHYRNSFTGEIRPDYIDVKDRKGNIIGVIRNYD